MGLFDWLFGKKNWRKSYTSTIKNGIKTEVTKTHYGDQLIQEEPRLNGLIHGIVKEYYKNGQLKGESHYKEGKREGVFKSFYKNGQIKIDGQYKNDKKHGLVKIYYENGQLDSELKFENNVLISKHSTDDVEKIKDS